MTRLYLLRHGEAQEGFPDARRALIEKGRREVLKTLEKASERITTTPIIFHSGLVRAYQTAVLAADALKAAPPVLLEGIDPGGDPASLCRQSLPTQDLMLVTHNPFVEELVEYLSGDSLRIRTGSMVALDVEEWGRGCAELCWQIN